MDNRMTFEIGGSSGVVYVVTAWRSGEALVLTCTCDGARNGAACKHRLALLAGDGSAVIAGDPAGVAAIGGWLPGTALANALAALAEAEAAAETAKRAVTQARKALGRIMAGAG